MKPPQGHLQRHATKKAPTQQQQRTKHISFDPNRNRVRFVRVPPRSQNDKYWFTETERVVRKGLQFEVEPNIAIEVTIDCRIKLTGLAQDTKAGSAGAAAPSGRVFLEVKEASPFFGDDAEWVTVGSVAPGALEKINVTLPSGAFQLRSSGAKASLQVLAEAWDLERELS